MHSSSLRAVQPFAAHDSPLMMETMASGTEGGEAGGGGVAGVAGGEGGRLQLWHAHLRVSEHSPSVYEAITTLYHTSGSSSPFT